jgi:CBS domain-containing protein
VPDLATSPPRSALPTLAVSGVPAGESADRLSRPVAASSLFHPDTRTTNDERPRRERPRRAGQPVGPGEDSRSALSSAGRRLYGSPHDNAAAAGERMTMRYLVGDLMTIDPVVIGPEARIEEAESIMELYHVSGLPVVDERGSLIGVISQTDLLRGGGDVNSLVRKRFTGLRVADLMSAPAITVEMTTPLIDAARLMREEQIHRVVAISDGGEPIGVLSSMDFVALYADESND